MMFAGNVKSDEENIYIKVSDAVQLLRELPSIQPTTKENLVVEDCISRAELLKAVDTWDKFGCDVDTKLVPVKDCYVPYIHYDDVVKAIKGMPPITPQSKTIQEKQADSEKYQKAYDDGYEGGYAQARFDFEPKTGHWISDKNGQYCDKCGNGIKTPYNFCPFCGADMREYTSEIRADSEKE